MLFYAFAVSGTISSVGSNLLVLLACIIRRNADQLKEYIGLKKKLKKIMKELRKIAAAGSHHDKM